VFDDANPDMRTARTCNKAGLTKVDLWGCKQLTDGGIGELARHCAALTEVNLHGCKLLTDGGIVDFNCRTAKSDKHDCAKSTDPGTPVFNGFICVYSFDHKPII
jgi:hypothetical protein